MQDSLRHSGTAVSLELVTDCPACVGPPGEIGPNTKAVTRHLLQILLE